MARGPKPSLFLVCFFFLFLFCFCFGGFKGQVRWPKGPPHLALNPPYILFLCFFGCVCCSFPFFALSIQENLVFPLEKGIFLFIFECLPLFLLSFFWPPPFSSVSFSVLSLLLVRFSFPSCSFFFAFFCFLVFVSVFPFLFSLLLFHEKNNIKIFQLQNFPSSIFSLFLVSCLLFSLKSLFLLSLFFLLIVKLCFCSTSLFLVKKKKPS